MWASRWGWWGATEVSKQGWHYQRVELRCGKSCSDGKMGRGKRQGDQAMAMRPVLRQWLGKWGQIQELAWSWHPQRRRCPHSSLCCHLETLGDNILQHWSSGFNRGIGVGNGEQSVRRRNNVREREGEMENGNLEFCCSIFQILISARKINTQQIRSEVKSLCQIIMANFYWALTMCQAPC